MCVRNKGRESASVREKRDLQLNGLLLLLVNESCGGSSNSELDSEYLLQRACCLRSFACFLFLVAGDSRKDKRAPGNNRCCCCRRSLCSC